jgi:hypothetical protein
MFSVLAAPVCWVCVDGDVLWLFCMMIVEGVLVNDAVHGACHAVIGALRVGAVGGLGQLSVIGAPCCVLDCLSVLELIPGMCGLLGTCRPCGCVVALCDRFKVLSSVMAMTCCTRGSSDSLVVVSGGCLGSSDWWEAWSSGLLDTHTSLASTYASGLP